MKQQRVTTRSVYFLGDRTIDIRSENHEVTGNEVVVRSKLIGISHGTEMLFYRGPFPEGNSQEALPDLASSNGYPLKYGYMNVGITDDEERVFCFAPHQDVLVTRPEDLLPIPDEVDWEDAVLYPSVETALQIVHDAAPRLGESVLVFGLGTVGLLVSRLAVLAGAHVLCVDPLASRRDRAARLDLKAADPLNPAFPELVGQATSGAGADIAINCSASDRALQSAIELVAVEGTVVEASWYGERSADVRLGVGFHRHRVTLRSSQVSRLNPQMQPRWDRQRRTRMVWDLMPHLSPGKLITHQIDLDDAAKAYQLIDSASPDVQQIVLVP